MDCAAIIALGRGVQRRRVLRGGLVKSTALTRLELMLALKHEDPHAGRRAQASGPQGNKYSQVTLTGNSWALNSD